MKAELIEYDECFSINLTPETMKEQAVLIRMGINATKEVRSFSADIYTDLHVSGYVVIGKRKNSNSDVPKRK